MQIKDMYTPHGVIRPDGRMVHDVYLFQVKTPTESKCLWDYHKLVQVIPGKEALLKKNETSVRCGNS